MTIAGADCASKEFKVAYLYDKSKRHRCVGVPAGNHEAAGRLMQPLGAQAGWSRAEEKIALIGGAPWIRNQIEFRGLTENIGLDFYHRQDNAQNAKLGVFGEDSEEGQAWVGDLMHTFQHEGYSAAWDVLLQTHSSRRSPRKRAALDRLTQYTAERRAMIR